MSRKPPSSVDGSSNKTLALLIGTTCGIVAAPNLGFAGPTGGVVTGGQGTISTPTATSTVIDQTSNRLSLDWQSFDVAANESVSFNQPSANSVALNRILDQKASEVFGRIDANGRVVLFNSNGILFGPGSQVNVGSLVATSLNVVSFDEATGQLRLSATGTPGSVVNSGTISAATGGSVSLVGGAVANNGLIVADLGAVNLAAGRAATIDLYGGGLLRFDADSALLENSSGATAGVANSGDILANGGQVLLTTSAVQNVFDRAVNNDGVVRANRIENVGGTIRLVGPEGTVVNRGVLDASGVGAGSTGGEVQVLGQNVGLFGAARIDVSGDAGGGAALIGGDYQGNNPDVLNANRTIVGPDARISADARVAGDGGRVILWSEEGTRFYGDITARGGANSGNGGLAEVSSHGGLDFSGTVNLSASSGTGGRLLLDPITITIEQGGDTDVTLDFDDTPDDATVDPDSIEAALNSANVELQATDDIFVNDEIVGTGANRGITLRAGDDIEINANITTNNGAIVLSANDPGTTPNAPNGTGNVTFAAPTTTLDAGTAGITIVSEGTLALGTLEGGAINLTSQAGAITNAGATLTGTSLTASAGTSINLATDIGTLTDATAAGAIVLNNTGNLVVTEASGDDVTLSASGDLQVGTVNAADTASLGATGAITDGAGVSVTADQLTISVAQSVDLTTNVDTLSVTNVGAGGITITESSGPLTVADASSVGGAVEVQTVAGALNVTNASGAGVTLISNDDMTLGTVTTTGNVALAANGGGAITDGVGVSVTANQLTISAAGSANLGTNVNTLSASNVGAGGLTISEASGPLSVANATSTGAVDISTVAGALNVTNASGAGVTLAANGVGGTLQATTVNGNTGTVSLTSNGDMTLGTVNTNAAGGVTLTANGGGVISDGAGVSVTANQLTITQAGTVDLNTNVSALSANNIGNGGLTINEANGLAVSAANSFTGAVDISTAVGTLDVDGVIGGGGVTLSSGGNLLADSVNGGSGPIALTSNGDMTLGVVVTGGINTVTLTANGNGAITDGGGGGASVNADELRIMAAGSVDLNTDVNILSASNVGPGGLTISDAGGLLAVTNAVSTGAVDISNASGTMLVTNAEGAGVTLAANGAGGALQATAVNGGAGPVALTSNGNMTLGSVTTGGNVTLTANGAGQIIEGAGVSVTGNQLTITAAGSADLTTNVNTLTANNIGVGGLTIVENAGPLTVANAQSIGAVDISTNAGSLSVTNANGNGVTLTANGGGSDLLATNVNAGGGAATLTANRNVSIGSVTAAGAATLTATTGAILDDDDGTSSATDINASSVALTAATSIGTVTNFGDAEGLSVDVTTNGTLSAVTTTNGAGSAINLNISGAPIIGLDGIVLGPFGGTNRSGSVLLQSAGNLDVSGPGPIINIGAANTVSVGLVSDGVLTLPITGSPTDTSPTTLLVSGTDVVQSGAPAGTVNLSANTLYFNASAPANAFQLNTNVETLNANVAGTLNVDELVGDITLGNITAQTLSVQADTAGGAILDDNNDSTIVTADSIFLGTTNEVGSVAGQGSIDVDTADLAVFAGTGDVVINSVGAAPMRVALTAGNAAPIGSNGNVVLNASGDVRVAQLVAVQDNVNVTSAGQIVNDVPGAVVMASQLAIGGASAVNLGADIDTLNASGVTGNLIVSDASGALTVANASAGGDVSLSALAGAMTVANATGANVALSASSDIALGAVGATNTVSMLAGGNIGDAPDAIPSVAANQLTITGANAVDLDTNVNVLDATGVAGNLTVREQTGNLQVANANSTSGAVSVTSVTGALTNVNAAGSTVTLDAATDMSLATVTSAGIVALEAAGAITDAAGATPSVNANQLVMANTASADLDTNVNVLDANVSGNLAIREQSGNLLVGNAHSTTGVVDVSAAAGALTVTNASGFGVFLDAGTDLTLGTVNTAFASLSAGGAITDAVGAIPSVVANQLEVTAAGSVDLDTDVNSLQASGVSGALNIREQTGGLAILDASSAGAVNVSTVDGALLVANAAGNGVTLTAGGATSDLNANGGVVNAGSGVATLTAGRALIASNVSGGSAILTSNGAMTLGSVNANPASGTVTLAAGTGSITDAAGAAPSVSGNQLTIASAASANLDTNVNTLNASGVSGALTIREQAGNLAVANASAAGMVNVSTVAGALTNVNASGAHVQLSAGGAGNGISLVSVNAGAGAGLTTLTAGGAIGDAAGATPSVVAGQLTITAAQSADLDTDVGILNASNVTGALNVREQVGDLLVQNATAGSVNLAALAGGLNVTNAAGNGVTLSANTDLGLLTVSSGAGTTTLEAGGAIVDDQDGTPSVVGNQLTITGATLVALDTDVNVLDASGISGTLSITEQSGDLAVANANAGGGVYVSTVDGDLDIAEAHSNGALVLTAGGTGAMTVASSTASGAAAILTSGGDMTLGTLNTTDGPTVLDAGGALRLGTINAAQGAVELTANGAISDAAGAAPSVVASQLTIGGATSVNLDTNVSSLVADNVTGDLTIREQAGSLSVASANASGAVNVSTVAGALTDVNVSGSSVMLSAGGAGSGLTLLAVDSATGTTTLSAGGAISDGAGATPSVVASQLDITGAGSVDLDTDVDTLGASAVSGALNVREQTGDLTVANASAGGALNLSTVAGDLVVTHATGSGVTLNAGGAGSALTLGSVSAGGGAATLTAGGAITDGTTGTALTAGNAHITAGSIGAADNVLDTAVASLTAATSAGSMHVREADNLTLTSLTAPAGEDIVVGAFGDITVSTIANANGRVLLAAGNDILADSSVSGAHITAGDAELRAGGLNASGGAIGTNASVLRMNVPQTIAGVGGEPVPSVLLLQNRSATDASAPAKPNQIATVGDLQISVATFNAAQQTPETFLTTTFSARTAQNDGVLVANTDFFGQAGPGGAGALAVNTLAAANANAASTNASAASAQGEGALYIDWASFDPNVSLYGTVNPPICLPGDQAEEDGQEGDASAAASGECAATTARYDGTFRLPDVKLVITSRGVEWVTTPSREITVFPLIGQLR